MDTEEDIDVAAKFAARRAAASRNTGTDARNTPSNTAGGGRNTAGNAGGGDPPQDDVGKGSARNTGGKGRNTRRNTPKMKTVAFEEVDELEHQFAKWLISQRISDWPTIRSVIRRAKPRGRQGYNRLSLQMQSVRAFLLFLKHSGAQFAVKQAGEKVTLKPTS